jgi:putative membrane protein
MWDSMHWGWSGWVPFGLMHLLWWILIIAVIVALVRGIGGRPRRLRGEDRALEILRERYARGEIDKTEYEQRKRDLAT